MRECPADRISNLPCDIINLILEHLPLFEAVRTSILSRGWRYKWVTIRHLSFDGDFEDLLDDEYNLESVIDYILVVHKGDVVKFSLDFRSFSLEGTRSVSPPAINRWLLFLSNHRVEDLSFYIGGRYHMMPIHFFSFDHLTHLDIGSCEVKLPPTFRGFSRLVRLVLVDLNIESRDIQMWLSKCPMLEYLSVDLYQYDCLYLDIDAPNLKVFHFLGHLGSICIKNSNLEEISISCDGYSVLEDEVEYFKLPDSRGDESNLSRVLGHTLSLKKLYLDCSTMPYWATGGLPRKLQSNLNLTLLEFSSFVFGGMINIACAFCLIRSSPNLQSLKLSPSYHQGITSEENAVVQYLKEEQQKCDIHSRLKYVKICGISNMEHEMELVKLLLRLATALEKLEIESKFSKSTDKQDAYKMVKEIASFHRASSQAAVIFD